MYQPTNPLNQLDAKEQKPCVCEDVHGTVGHVWHVANVNCCSHVMIGPDTFENIALSGKEFNVHQILRQGQDWWIQRYIQIRLHAYISANIHRNDILYMNFIVYVIKRYLIYTYIFYISWQMPAWFVLVAVSWFGHDNCFAHPPVVPSPPPLTGTAQRRPR